MVGMKGDGKMLGGRIALLRRHAGLSQRKLASALHVSASTVGMYEQGRRTPPNVILLRMAELFGVTTDFLLRGEAAGADQGTLRGLLAEQSARYGIAECDAALLLSAILSAGELTPAQKSAMMKAKGGGVMKDEEFMRRALALARDAAEAGEVPVGCVIVDGERVVGCGRNRREEERSALCHAELEAIDEACRTLGGWRLWRCTLYVTLEPCPMCAGAIINARIARVVYGAPDAKAGSCGSLTDLFALPYNHRPEVTAGVLQEESQALLQEFFRQLRENPKPRWYKPAL